MILLLSALSTQLSAQIENEIRNYVDTTEKLVNNGRRLMGQALADQNLRKVQEIYYYLGSVTENSRYSAFSYTEHLYLCMIISDWERWAALAENISTFRQKILYPEKYSILDLLQEEVVRIAESGSGTGNRVVPDLETNELIDLYLHLLGNDFNEEYNRRLKQFRSKYPESRYNDFLASYMPGKYMKGSWTWMLGAAYISPLSAYRETFSPSPVFSMSMDFNIGRVFTSLFINAGKQELLTPFTATTSTDIFDFTPGEKFSYFDGGIMAGYFLVRGDRVNLAPYISLGGGTLESDRFAYEDDKYEIEVFNTFIYGAGVHAEIKLFSFDMNNPYGYGTVGNSFISLKVEGGYNALSSFRIPQFEGNAAYIKAGLVWGIGDF